ncbi:MAG: gas vesicle protein K [Chloroflexi bacterium]|nr:gas vesicle protein K [Chloroflexota bacterium]
MSPAELEPKSLTLPERINATPEDVEQGLAKLVLSLIEFLRRVLERQAIRRMDGGELSDADIERMGLTLMKLEEKLAELASQFGLSADDLNIDLGPLGKLL